jgi:chromosome segregation ATPase
MIHQSLIDAARNIRKDYERRQEELLGHIESTESLKDFLEDCVRRVQKVEENASKQIGTIDSNKEELVATLNEIDERSKDLVAKIHSINKEIEELSGQELRLFNIIKSRYPSMTEEQIKIEVQTRI